MNSKELNVKELSEDLRKMIIDNCNLSGFLELKKESESSLDLHYYIERIYSNGDKIKVRLRKLKWIDTDWNKDAYFNFTVNDKKLIEKICDNYLYVTD